MTGRVSYLVEQRFRYEYPQPIRELRHRLIVVPPARHGDQRTVASRVSASVPADERRWTDEHGNVCVEFIAPAVEASVEFRAWIVVSRAERSVPSRHDGGGLLDATELTAPCETLERAALGLRAGGLRGLELAEAANDWTHRALTYEAGVTTVDTTAAAALALGRGVCQDFAHVMLALCRLLGLPARYVSGHVPGEGGTHAWVEVLLADSRRRGLAAHAFDPTRGGRPGLDSITVATGRDYRDVAPTSGTYVGAASGHLSATRRMEVLTPTVAGGRRYRPAESTWARS